MTARALVFLRQLLGASRIAVAHYDDHVTARHRRGRALPADQAASDDS